MKLLLVPIASSRHAIKAAGGHDLESKPPSPTTPGAKDRARPRWVFDTQAASTKQEANAFDVLEQVGARASLESVAELSEGLATPYGRLL